MNLRNTVFAFLTFMVPALATAAPEQAVVHARLDSMMLWVGQQTGLELEVSCDNGSSVEFPVFGDTIVSGLEIVPPIITDTDYVNSGKRMTVTRKYTVTCFDSALIFIPPLPVTVDGVQYESDAMALSFQSFDIPEGQENELCPPKPNYEMKLVASELGIPFLYLAIAAIAFAAAIFMHRRYKDDRPIIRRIKLEPKVPAHVRALTDIENLRQSGGAHEQDPKEYYTRLTDIIRTYINERFGFNATEMTSAEILENLESHPDHASMDELTGLLSTADMVKFAKVKPLLGENDRNLLGAMEFVKETKRELTPEELNPKLEETVVVEKRSKEARMAILACFLALSATAAVFYVLLFVKLYYLFF